MPSSIHVKHCMFTVTQEIAWSELEARIRQVPLLEPRDGERVYPYATATITLQEVRYDQVQPTSLYALRSHLAFQTQFAADLAATGHDPLGLTGGLKIAAADGTETTLIPPIVEVTPEDGAYILDGLHRTYVGLKAGKAVFTAIHITDIDHRYPAAAFPNMWSEVVEYDDVPTDPLQKRHYRPNPLTLRRDFSSINGSRPRTV